MDPSDERMSPRYDYQDPRNMMWLWGRFLMIPAAAIVYSVEMLLQTLQGMQQLSTQGLGVMVGPVALSNAAASIQAATGTAVNDSQISTTNNGSNRTTNEEEKNLIDNNQNFCKPDEKEGKCLILWRYKVLFIKRDLEHAFPEVEDLVSDDVSDLTAWKIAEFIQSLGQRKVRVPSPWIDKQYPPAQGGQFEYWRIGSSNEAPTLEAVRKALANGEHVWLTGLPEADKKFLRLYSERMASYARQDPKYEEQQIEVLKEIRDRL